jgi:putative FmdB family regulatory protein
MPIYEYSCKKCGKTIEVIQKFSDSPLKKHQGCGGALTKLISASGFQFKGTGWYVTDYARKGKSGDSEHSSDGSKDGSKEATKETKEEKPAAKESPKKSSGKSTKSGE